MLRVLDLLAAVPSPYVSCDDLVFLGDPNGVEVGENRQRTLRPIVRDRVIVEIEASVRSLANFDIEALVSRKWLVREHEKLAALIVEGITHRARRVFDPFALGRARRDPLVGLTIEIGEIGVRARGEESVANVANRTLDAALFVAARDSDGPDFEMVVRRDLLDLGIEPNDVAAPLKHGAFEIVVEQHARHAAEECKSVDVPAEEIEHRGAEKEAQIHLPRETQHHHEGPQDSLGASDLHLSEVRPVDLRLLTGERFQALKCLCWLAWTVPTNDAPEVICTAGITARFDHLEQATRTKARIFL